MNRFTKVWHPDNYQNGRKARGYFEGWYFKAVDAAGDGLAVIPGVAMPRDGHPFAFVQLNRSGGRSAWFELPYEEFTYSRDRLDLTVGRCRFWERGMTLDLAGPAGEVKGDFTFGGLSPWPVTLLSPGIMGPFRFVPFMECYHGVVSMDHSVSGTLEIDGETRSFDLGRGYIEKDWGRSFPKAWIWTQSNRFDRDGVSLTASVARIPWLGTSFVGFIAGLLVDGTLHRFATYTGARLVSIRHDENGGEFVLQDRHRRIEIAARGAAPGKLRAPVLGEMKGTVNESMCSETDVRLTDRASGAVLFEGTGRSAGLELMDPTGDLLGG